MFTIAGFDRALEASLAPLAATPRPLRLCVGLSGGLDSSVLLVAAADLVRSRRPTEFAVRALHVDHGLHAQAPRWSEASRDLCQAHGVGFEVVQVDARAATGASPEASAREARYAAYSECLGPDEVLLTAHHADDQLETILLQWLRGGGLRAVAGMSPFARLEPHAWHARPLLAFTRADLEQWARGRGLAWVEDPSNLDRRFDRNYLRHEVLPRLRRRWPAAAHTAGRVAEFARDALALEAAVAAEDLASIRRGRALDLAGLWSLPEPRQRAVLRAWCGALGLPLPSADQLTALSRDMRVAAADRIPESAWRGVRVHRYRGRLHAEPADDRPLRTGTWTRPTKVHHDLGPASSLSLVADVGHGIGAARLPGALLVNRRDGGEAFRPPGVAHHRPLRKWLQERGVLPWRRGDLPLLYDPDGRLVAVADLCCTAEFAAQPDEPSWRVVWHGRGIVTEPDAIGFRWPADPPIG